MSSGPGVARRIGVLLAVLGIALFLFWASLLMSSAPLDPEARVVLDRAIGILDERGFSREAFVLRHVASVRASDNWLNAYLGHQQAYAATNFPFEVLTLYPRFFTIASDDTERAVILLHESRHLFGNGEDAALERTWRDKARLGWTADRYGDSRLWRHTREWTEASRPELFACAAAQGCAE